MVLKVKTASILSTKTKLEARLTHDSLACTWRVFVTGDTDHAGHKLREDVARNLAALGAMAFLASVTVIVVVSFFGAFVVVLSSLL